MKSYNTEKITAVKCYHCGENCEKETIKFDDKNFCCDGCRLVYDLLKDKNLCTYYNLNTNPGASPAKVMYKGKYDYLDNKEVSRKFIRFASEGNTHVTFYIPNIHCSSCIWLLENLHKMNKGIVSSTVNFMRKEATVIYNPDEIKLSSVAELLAQIGYEPLINLNDLESKPEKLTNRSSLIKIGIAGFCFGNIMMLSFPEYFALGNFSEQPNLKTFFGYLNILLSLPVFFYSASGFFSSAYKSIIHRYINIDAPIALAILATFLRSIYEITTHTGPGYMDSMTGIVFFMLIGRYFQNKTYETLSFERDYKSYFPIGVSVIYEDGKEENLPVSELNKGDHIIIRNNELIPSDALLLSNFTHIDYSFITGESSPVKRKKGDLIYAGGKQLYGAIELEIINPVSQSYLTQLWNKDVQSVKESKANKYFVDTINKYFSIAVLAIALLSAAYWMYFDSSKALNALSSVLLVACPCGLLLTATFANGNLLRIFGRNKFYLKNASVIDKLRNTDTIIFDKTGTITHGSNVKFSGKVSDYMLQLVTSLAAQSSHPLSRKIHYNYNSGKLMPVSDFEEITGKGIKGYVDSNYVILGSEYFVTGRNSTTNNLASKVFLMIEGEVIGYFSFYNAYREGLEELIGKLSGEYDLNLLSGDNDSESDNLKKLFGKDTPLYFNQKPEEKKMFVERLLHLGKNVMMIGDGLNDAGALKQSDIGIAVSDDTNNFSPACDAILDGESFAKLPAFIHLAKAGKNVIIATFIVSILYNAVGLSFAIQGLLSPVIAAILMPISSVSIVLLVTISTSIIARRKGL